MIKIQLDKELWERIPLDIESGIELCDVSGRVIGILVSPAFHRELIAAWGTIHDSHENRGTQSDQDAM